MVALIDPDATFHFVLARDGSGPQLWMRNSLNDWFMVRFGWGPRANGQKFMPWR
jgi:hypothetical protein